MNFRKRDNPKQLVAVTLGERNTVVACFEKRDSKLVLLDYVLEKSPIPEKGFSQAVLTEHFRAIFSRISGPTKNVAVALNMGEAVLRNVVIPKAPLSDQRNLLRRNPKAFFQLELADYVFDCYSIKPPARSKSEPPAQEGVSSTEASATETAVLAGMRSPLPSNRETVFAMGAPSNHVDELLASVKQLRLKAEVITCTQAGLINAARTTLAESLRGKIIAVVDIGFKHTALSILMDGVPMMTRVANSGGDTITSNLAEAMNVEYAAAEAVKLTMPEKVEKKLHSVIDSLSKELRSALEYFEETHGAAVSRIFFAGGTAKSKFLIQMFESGLGLPCEVWDATPTLEIAMPQARASELKVDFPQLTTAVGVAFQGLVPGGFQVDLLSEGREARARQLRDPIRWGMRISAVLVAAMVGWAAVLLVRQGTARLQLGAARSQLQALQRKEMESRALYNAYTLTNRMIGQLHRLMTERFLWAEPLDALQFCLVNDIQVTKIRIDENTFLVPGIQARTNKLGNVVPGVAAVATLATTLTISSKDYASPPAAEQFVEAISAHPYFREKLKRPGGIRLKDRLPPRVDPFDPDRVFIPFTIECQFQERVVRDE